MKKKKIFILIGALFLLFAFLFYIFKIANHHPKDIDLIHDDDFFGVTFSKKYSEELGLDWREAYLAILDDLKVKKIRVPVYWDQVEKEPGVFDFSDYEFIIEEGEKRDVEFILNFGMRVARWPECHIPSWLDLATLEHLQNRTLFFLEAVVYNFRDYESIAYWQLENEPLLDFFGECPKGDYDFLKKEFSLVKKMDSRPIIISATGELSFWLREAKLADIFGTTMYRVVYNEYLGYLRYPYSSSFYKAKARFAGVSPEDVFIVELQAEPWVSKERLLDIDDTEYRKSFNIDQFKANAQIAINTGFDRAYLWGVEWWYFKYKNNNPEYWLFAKSLF
jgi:hypothetical protein